MGLFDWLRGKKETRRASLPTSKKVSLSAGTPSKQANVPAAAATAPSTEEQELIRWEEILLRNGAPEKPGLGLADPHHPARTQIDYASAIANEARVAMTEGKTIVEAIPPRFIAALDSALERTPADADLLVAKSSALFWFGEFKEAQRIIDRVLLLEPNHFEARQRKNHWGTSSDLFCFPSWTERDTSLDPAMAKALDFERRSVQLVRDGMRIGITVIRDATSIKMPKPLTNVMRHKWEVVWSETPYSPIVANYLLVEDDPLQPFRTEAFLSTNVPSNYDPSSGYWLLQRASQIDSCFLVITRGSEVLFNVRYVFPRKLASTLREIAESCARRSLRTADDFAAAQQWHMDNFDMKQIRFEPAPAAEATNLTPRERADRGDALSEEEQKLIDSLARSGID
jgi:tetratricopeptide (TPR) repeat protein